MICMKCKKETEGTLTDRHVRVPLCAECFKPKRPPSAPKKDKCACGEEKWVKSKMCRPCSSRHVEIEAVSYKIEKLSNWLRLRFRKYDHPEVRASMSHLAGVIDGLLGGKP